MKRVWKRSGYITVALICACLCTILSGINCFAMVADTLNLKGEISTGTVKCQSEFTSVDKLSVKPGDVLNNSFKIKNIGTVPSICRVRVEKCFKNLNSDSVDDSLDSNKVIINYNYDSWSELNGYLYYKKPIFVNTYSDSLFDTILYDGSADNSYKNKEVNITITTEVVQAVGNGFEYFGIKPEDIDYQGDIEKGSVVSSSIELKDSGFEFNDDAKNTFKGFSNISANESRSQIINVVNTSSNESTMYMSVNNILDDKKVLDSIRVNMLLDGSSIYSGTFEGLKDISLGSFKQGERKELQLRVSSSSGINNDVADSKAVLDWSISANIKEKGISTSDETNKEYDIQTPIKTGMDVGLFTLLFLIMLTSGALVIILIRKGYNEKVK